jgi:hypothetical protein
LFAVLFVGLNIGISDAANKKSIDVDRLVKMAVIVDGAELRAEPRSKGKVLARADTEGINSFDILFVDPVLIQDKSDNSRWYKVLFTSDTWSGGFSQPNKISYLGFSYLYVNAKHVRKAPLTKEEKEHIAWFKRGRPPRFQVGDSLSKVKDIEKRIAGVEGGYRLAVTQAPATLYKEPRPDAVTFTLPKGSKIVDPYEWSVYAGTDLGWAVGGYIDMEEDVWTAIFDGKSLKIIGWIYRSSEKTGKREDVVLKKPTQQEVDNPSVWRY